MEELERQLESLRRVKPSESWVFSVKNEIIERPSLSLSDVMGKVYLAVSVFALVFIFGLNLYETNVKFPKVTSANLSDLEGVSTDLQSIGDELILVRKGIESIEDVSQVVQIGARVERAIQDAQSVVEVSKNIVDNSTHGFGASDNEFTVISGVSWATEEVEKATQDLEEAYLARQREIVEIEIVELDERSLNIEQESLLQDAKDLYNKGRFTEALLKILEVQGY